ncbi:MAG: hypothetical protein JWM11_5729 [Planctomycetaceae bacterium]|nr:hypothetical protein [Planctomycetaceae bacterium]
MTSFALPLPQTKHLNVPRENQSWLLSPSEDRAVGLVASNAKALAAAEIEVQGCSLSCLRTRTRYAVLNAARRYTMAAGADIGGTDRTADLKNWVVGGHQPALFHPGVWAKNFAMAHMASRIGAVSLNLVVDNDAMASSSIRVPTGSLENPQAVDIPFDIPQSKQPWENVKVQDVNLFRAFPQRVREAMRAWNFAPLLETFWPRVLEFHDSTPRLADAFTAARNQQERKWGAANLELPLSHLCQLPPFLWFACHILAHLPRFREIYNRAVRDYRRANHIHSTSHPVPELTQLGEWLEAPFWVWRKGESRRSRLFVQQRGPVLVLAKEAGEVLVELPLTADSHAQIAVERLQELETQGISIRTRALTTTLFSRTCLADLFIHGIGGAKYDEITDQLISQFFHLPVPAYWVVTGTLYLPLETQAVTADDLTRYKRRIWDLQWNPATALADVADQRVQDLCADFHELLRQPAPDRAARRARHRKLSEIKAELSKWAIVKLPEAQAQITQATRQLAANRVLQNRDYASVLHPEQSLKDFLQAGH